MFSVMVWLSSCSVRLLLKFLQQSYLLAMSLYEKIQMQFF